MKYDKINDKTIKVKFQNISLISSTGCTYWTNSIGECNSSAKSKYVRPVTLRYFYGHRVDGITNPTNAFVETSDHIAYWSGNIRGIKKPK